MKISKKIGAALGAFAMVGGMGLVAAAPAQAATVQVDSQTLFRDSSTGLSGSISTWDFAGRPYTATNGSYRDWSEYDTGKNHIDQIQAGSGYCVWEELFATADATAAPVKIGDYNYGKSLSSRRFTLQSSKNIQDAYRGPSRYKSTLRIYAC